VWSDYLFADSVQDALQLLSEHGGDARLIAGGTDLVIQCQRNKCPARVLVDVTRIAGLDGIEEEDGWLVLGAAVAHTRAASSPVVRLEAGLLAQACSVIGGPQVRNMGTLVGNLVTALPAADAALALVALGGEADVATPAGGHRLPLIELHQSVGACRVNPCVEMIVRLRVPMLGPEYHWAHERLARRKVHALPILNVGVIAALRDGRFYDVRIALGPVAPTPLRVREAEAFLEGQSAQAEVIREAAGLAASCCRPRDSLLRGSGEYRQALAGVMVRRALARVAGLEAA
jgi:CO/xanthine dehydrogenase FAD-binding subunit